VGDHPKSASFHDLRGALRAARLRYSKAGDLLVGGASMADVQRRKSKPEFGAEITGLNPMTSPEMDSNWRRIWDE
jgi:hypothetical protein